MCARPERDHVFRAAPVFGQGPVAPRFLRALSCPQGAAVTFRVASPKPCEAWVVRDFGPGL